MLSWKSDIVVSEASDALIVLDDQRRIADFAHPAPRWLDHLERGADFPLPPSSSPLALRRIQGELVFVRERPMGHGSIVQIQGAAERYPLDASRPQSVVLVALDDSASEALGAWRSVLHHTESLGRDRAADAPLLAASLRVCPPREEEADRATPSPTDQGVEPALDAQLLERTASYAAILVSRSSSDRVPDAPPSGVQSLLESAPVAIFCDHDGAPGWDNRRARTQLGAPRTEPMTALLQPDDEARPNPLDEEARPYLLHLQGEDRRVWVSTEAVRAGEGERRLYFVTEPPVQVVLDEGVLRSNRLVALGTLAAGVTHEINNPLAYVHGNLDYAARELRRFRDEEGYLEWDEVTAALEEAASGAERLRRLVKDLRTVSRPAEEEAAPVPLVRVLDAVMNLASAELQPRARVVRSYREVPPVMGRETQLGQVFLNLILNAAAAMEGDAKTNQLEVRLDSVDDEVVVQVRDTGHGMTDEVRSRVFEPFFTTKQDVGGTGLGLAICRNIVHAHGGTIDVTTEVGVGTTFRVRFPSCQARISNEGPRPNAVGRCANILVVDDDQYVANAIRRVLMDEHHVILCHSAKEALDRCGSRSERIDAIVCDVMMPEVSGLEMWQRLADVDAALQDRVVFVTGGTLSIEAAKALEEGSRRVLPKPVDVHQLRRIVKEIVEAG